MALTLTACAAGPGGGDVTTAPPTSSPVPTATPTPTPTGPVLVPDGSADDNLSLFTSVVNAVWATPEQAQGRAYVDALAAAGFDKGAMQVTQDLSTVGNAAESMQFSVRWDDECLVGQVGPSTGAPFTTIVPLLEGDLCLVGRTRPIDW